MELLERHFDIALKSPDGIKKLRELILSLAMQGKLVPQNVKDQSASELLKEIEAEKKKLIKEGKIKKQEPLPPIKPEEIPYEAPVGWVWVRLGTILSKYGAGSTPLGGQKVYKDNGIMFLRSQNIWNDGLRIEDVARIEQSTHEKMAGTKVETNDILLNITGASIGRSAIFPSNFDEANVSQHVAILRSISRNIVPFLHGVVISPLFQKTIMEKQVGVSREGLSMSKLKDFLIPLPPLAEQKRIVAKIDQLMAQCDKLEAERDARNKKRVILHTAAMDRLLSAPDEAAFSASWEFIIRNFSDLYSVPENVAELKKAILQLAVMGKLVTQDPNDQPASELLKEIEAEKRKLIKAGKIKKQEPLSPIKPEEIPYEVPAGWEWTQLNILGEINPRNNVDDDIMAAFIPMPMIFAEYGKAHSFEEKKWSEIKKGYTHFAENDVAIAKITPCFENGKSCVMKNLPNGVGAGTTELHVFRNLFGLLFPEYILIYFKGLRFILNGIPKMTGSAGQKRIPREYFACSPFPLPPLAEQKRIVAKVEQLMELCNFLEQQLQDSTRKQTAILDAVLATM